ncbi:FG-GAP-like repeat-containing protein [Fodinicola feengrottensis]|uniref:FG-GAP repeat domain-containing protein n=1 Tax=Fodinicola feengrottensis TaxID=435914 RepID=UPI003CD05EDC
MTGLTVTGTRHAVRLQWNEPTSAAGATLYRVYSSPSSDVPVGASTLIGTSRTTSYVQIALPAKQTRYYRVVAVDPGGLAADASAVVSATTKVATHNDFSGDGKDDVLTFTRGTAATAYGATSTGAAFAGDGVLVASGVAPGTAVPLTGDVDGDGRTDIIWFVRGGSPKVYVQLSNGSTFGAPQLWHSFFALDSEIPLVGDFNGDGRADIATFTRGASYGPGQVYVALSTGSSFEGTSQLWDSNFGYGSEPPAVGDFNGDGMDDIATFSQGTTGDVYVALSNGARFLGNGGDNLWNGWFAPAGETPAVGDFNGDGRDDIVTFTQANPALVYVGLSDGTQFGAGAIWHHRFSLAGEVPGVGDFDGDGKSDIVTFTRGTAAQVYVSLSNGTSFVQDGWLWHNHFCVGSEWPQPSRLLG